VVAQLALQQTSRIVAQPDELDHRLGGSALASGFRCLSRGSTICSNSPASRSVATL
jgi:hypothetical protein